VLGLVRARRGDPEQWTPLEQAWRLAEPTGELGRLGPVAAARAEAAWLAADPAGVASALADALPLALDRHWGWLIGDLTSWGRRADLDDSIPTHVPGPYALERAGDWEQAAARWSELGC